MYNATMSAPCVCEAVTEADTTYCCEAMPAWRQGRVDRALASTAEVISTDPTHAPGWLLHAYGLWRTGSRVEALGVMETLAGDPVVGRRARSMLRRHAHRRDRDQLSVSGGLQVGAGPGGLLVVDAPLGGRWGARFDTHGVDWGSLRGQAGGLAGTWSALARDWRLQLAVGLTGISDREAQSRIRAGAMASARVDVRPSQRIGFGVDAGVGTWFVERAQVYPLFRVTGTVFAPARRTW